MREVAAGRADTAGVTVELLDGGAEELPLGDASVDLVTCERVLQHLEDPDAAVREFARVLRPGGRVVVIDSDWATSIVHPGDQDVLERYGAFILTQWPNPYSGRLLRGQLRAAGLDVDPDIGSSALVFPDDGAARWGHDRAVRPRRRRLGRRHPRGDLRRSSTGSTPPSTVGTPSSR